MSAVPGTRTQRVDVASVEQALQAGLGARGSDIAVSQSRGIVELSGEVDTLADLQKAHYIARARPGVVEVDYRNLRVRQP